MVEILGGALSGQGCAAGERHMSSNGVLLTVYRIEHFCDLDRYYDEVDSLIAHVKSSRLPRASAKSWLPANPSFTALGANRPRASPWTTPPGLKSAKRPDGWGSRPKTGRWQQAKPKAAVFLPAFRCDHTGWPVLAFCWRRASFSVQRTATTRREKRLRGVSWLVHVRFLRSRPPAPPPRIRTSSPGSAGVPPAQDLAGSWRLASQGWSVHLPTGAGGSAFTRMRAGRPRSQGETHG